jgi:DNA-binding transcriptional LysR family regulator
MNLRAADLNLFVVFDALLEEQSVSRAARRIGLSQPATSNALARLRDLFGDVLFVRQGARMLPTSRAESIAAHVRAGLGHLDAALCVPASFDPATARRTFTIAANDFASFILLPTLMDRVRREAPGITIRVVPYGPPQPIDQLTAGTVDLILGAAFDLPPHVASEDFMAIEFAVAVRADHPRVRKRLTLEQFVELDHLLVAPLGGARGTVDRALEELGLERRVALYVPDFLLAPLIVARTDLVVTLARAVLVTFATPFGLRVFAPPLRLRPFPYAGIWERRRDTDPAHRWLRDTIRDALGRKGRAGGRL